MNKTALASGLQNSRLLATGKIYECRHMMLLRRQVFSPPIKGTHAATVARGGLKKS